MDHEYRKYLEKIIKQMNDKLKTPFQYTIEERLFFQPTRRCIPDLDSEMRDIMDSDGKGYLDICGEITKSGKDERVYFNIKKYLPKE